MRHLVISAICLALFPTLTAGQTIQIVKFDHQCQLEITCTDTPNQVQVDFGPTHIDVQLNGNLTKLPNPNCDFYVYIRGASKRDEILLKGRNPRVDFVDIRTVGGDDRIENQTDMLTMMYCGEGTDLGIGGNGEDFMFGGPGDDVLSGGPGRDLIRGNDGSDLISGDEHMDSLNGGRGLDSIFGGDGDDFISDSYEAGLFMWTYQIPDNHVDLMEGGPGADYFDVFYGSYPTGFGQQMSIYFWENITDLESKDSFDFRQLSTDILKRHFLGPTIYFP